MRHAPSWLGPIALLLLVGQGSSSAIPPHEARWREVTIEPAPGGPTDLRLECFLVTGTRERLGELEQREEEWGDSPSTILGQLAHYGQADPPGADRGR